MVRGRFFFRFFAGIAALLLGLCGGVSAWLGSGAGARFLSGRISRGVQESAPGTAVTLERLQGRWPPTLEAGLVQWSDGAGAPILRMAPAILSAGFSRGLKAGPAWTLEGTVERLDLASLDRAVGRGELRAEGLLKGTVRLRGVGGRVEDLDVRLRSEPPGGRLNSRVMEELVAMMPPNDARRMLLKALGAKATFHFDAGRMDLTTEGDQDVLRMLLDGDHLMDLTVRMPRISKMQDISQDLLRFLDGMKSKEGKR